MKVRWCFRTCRCISPERAPETHLLWRKLGPTFRCWCAKKKYSLPSENRTYISLESSLLPNDRNKNFILIALESVSLVAYSSWGQICQNKVENLSRNCCELLWTCLWMFRDIVNFFVKYQRISPTRSLKDKRIYDQLNNCQLWFFNFPRSLLQNDVLNAAG
jgi:hypothetical protein